MAPGGPAPPFDTVILAGGAAVRMGADKPALAVGGVPMVVRVAAAAAAAGTRRLILVGPRRAGQVEAGFKAVAGGLQGGLVTVREEPPGGGPVAALRRGLAEVTAPVLALLAADLPFLTAQHIAHLLEAGPAAGAAGALLNDDDGRPQWLAGAWQTAGLRGALASYQGASVGGLLAGLGGVPLRMAAVGEALPPWHDCDTPDDLAVARAALVRAGRPDGD